MKSLWQQLLATLLVLIAINSANAADFPLHNDIYKALGGEDFPFHCFSDNDSLKYLSLRSSWESQTGYIVRVAPMFSDEIAIPVKVQHDEKNNLLRIRGKVKHGLVQQHFNGLLNLDEQKISRAELVPTFLEREPLLDQSMIDFNCSRDD